MFERILVPLDGSVRAERAIPVAARIARVTGGTVVLLQVTSIPMQYEAYLYESYLSQSPIFAQEILDAEKAKAKYYLDYIASSENLLDIKTETQEITGATALTILKVADSKHVDLIVMCSHGRTGFKRWALGSVAQKVARHSPIPVLLLREGNFESADLQADKTQVLRALVALDGSSFAEAALMPAAYLITVLASPGQGALHLAQVVHLPPDGDEEDYEKPGIDVREQAMQEAANYLSTLTENVGRSLMVEHGLKVTWSTAMKEDVADALIRMAELGEDTGTFDIQGCNLIAIATHGRGGLQHWRMGSITERVLGGTKLPLLIVRPQEQHTPTTSEGE